MAIFRLAFLLLGLLSGCGVAVEPQGSSTTTSTEVSVGKEHTTTNTNTSSKKKAAHRDDAEGEELPSTSPFKDDGSDDAGYLTGYIVSAFDMQVNGRRYEDSEDFYSSQLQELMSEMEDAGYEGYSFSFDGQLGLDDLKYGMDIYVVAQGKTGFAGDTTVAESGRFMLGIPDGSGDEVFRIRANKRISVTLTSQDKRSVVRWCYNFSSANTEGSTSEPVLISEFTTKLTRYQCSDDTGAGMTLPRNPKAPAVETASPTTVPAATTTATKTLPATATSTAVSSGHTSSGDRGGEDDEEGVTVTGSVSGVVKGSVSSNNGGATHAKP